MTRVTDLNKAKRAVFRLLESFLTNKGLDTWEYTNGSTDMKVLEAVTVTFPSSGITLGIVTGIRSRHWGKLYKEPVLTDAQRIAVLENQNAIQARKITELEKAQGNPPIYAGADDLFGK